MVVKEIIHPLFLLLASERSAEARILNCCHQAEWNGRTYDSSGTIKIGIDEVPLYRSVGDSTNSGNLVSMNWERSDGKVHPSLYVTKQTNIDGDDMMITEEIGKAETQVDGSLTCPDQMEWKDANDTVIEWKCLPPSDDCVNQHDFCNEMEEDDIAAKCTTLGKICCKTCTDYRLQIEEALRSKQDEITAAATANMPPEEEVQEGDATEADDPAEKESAAEESENETDPNTEPEPETKKPGSNETDEADTKTDPEPEPEGSNALAMTCSAIIVLSLFL
ncbi:Oidioi.mRNA.OKI2018_I69.chr2.g6554.t1.cds [Oikopleura dioica]|uniref:Oidioi.mRNA.OKI2018_I69.chr2.g6554.t1.cds n=1 Tax=Oikopleura dioica TaxID=34765 RepID=A0ABN7TCP3_OIKDI|nr:Oidioi.mRNA.OKI2018_I69.chr2.g6554.t1.cds [Oikopleura dioica]